MNNLTGSILEFKGKKAIVMTSTCDFVAIKKLPDMYIGQQINLPKSDFYNKSSNYLKYLATACMFVLIICSVLFFQIARPENVFAYIDVDINPSLELVLNKNGKVIDFEALNNDAKNLLKNMKLEGIPLKNALRIIVEESTRQGYISSDKQNAVLISASIKASKDKKVSELREKALDEMVTKLSAEDITIGSITVKPDLLKVTPEKRSEALKNNISMGRYVLYQKLAQDNNGITIEKAKNARVSDMLYSTRSRDQEISEKNSINKANENSKKSEGNGNKNSSGTINESKNSNNTLKSDNPSEKSRNEGNGNLAAKKPVGNSSQNKQSTKSNKGQSDKKDFIEGSSDPSPNDSALNPKSEESSNNSSDKKETFDQGSKTIKDNSVENKEPDSRSNGNGDIGNNHSSNNENSGKGKNGK